MCATSSTAIMPPNNAVLAISGNVTPDQVRRGVERWFDSIPRRDIKPRTYQPEPLPDAPRELEVRGHVPQTCVVVAYPMPGYGQPGYIECDLITDILASGRSSRFYRRLLLGGDLFTSADASIIGSEEPGMLMLKGHLEDPSEATARKAVERLMSEASELCYQASRLDRLSYNLTEAPPRRSHTLRSGTGYQPFCKRLHIFVAQLSSARPSFGNGRDARRGHQRNRTCLSPRDHRHDSHYRTSRHRSRSCLYFDL